MCAPTVPCLLGKLTNIASQEGDAAWCLHVAAQLGQQLLDYPSYKQEFDADAVLFSIARPAEPLDLEEIFERLRAVLTNLFLVDGSGYLLVPLLRGITAWKSHDDLAGC